MTLSEQRLLYCDLLLTLIKRAITWRGYSGRLGLDYERIWSLCDRFERALASVEIEPLLWEGDYA